MSHKIRALLIDLSGTVHVGDTLLPGVTYAVGRLKDSNFPYKFVTNSSKESRARLHSRLVNAGLDVNIGDIFTSLTAARQVVLDR